MRLTHISVINQKYINSLILVVEKNENMFIGFLSSVK